MLAAMRARQFLWFFLVGGCASLPDDQQPVTPQRPTLSSDTSTTARGTVEIEAGVSVQPGDLLDTPLALKWGSGEATEVFMGWSPWQQIDVPGHDLEGSSDVLVGMRHRFLEESEGVPSAALQLATKLPTGNDEVSTGEIDFLAAGIVTKRAAGVSWTGFYQLEALGSPGGRGIALGHDGALAAAGAIEQRWGWFGELAGRFVDELHHDSVFVTAGATYAPKDSMVFDAGVVVGLSDDAPDLMFVFGMTHNLGSIFGSARQPK